MQKLTRTATTPQFVPDFMATSLLDVDFAVLKAHGVKYVAFDADSTLVPASGNKLDPQTREFLQKNRHMVSQWCIASNRILFDLSPLGTDMDAHIIQASKFVRKPSRKFFARVTDYFKPTKPSEIAMIGDKLYADVFGGNRVGFTTVWVEHIGSDTPWDTVLQVRRIERRMMKPYSKSKP